MTIALDFDGVMHGYSRGWQGGKIYDPPVPGTAEAVRAILELEAAFVLTARDDLDAVAGWIEKELGIPALIDDPYEDVKFWNNKGVLLVTNRKLPARVYLDDRGVTFTKKGGWEQALQDLEIDLPERVYTYLVTVTVPGTEGHNPNRKITGPCPVNGEPCSDVTGKHHTLLVRSVKGVDGVRDECAEKYGHVTRVESVPSAIPF